MVKSKSKSKKRVGTKRGSAGAGCEVVSDGARGREGVRERGGCGVVNQSEDEVGELPCPVAADPAMGDKTPEVMAWYREYQPEEFKRRYGNRVCPEVDEGVRMMVRCGVRGAVGDGGGVDEDGGPVSDFEDEDDEVVRVKPRVIMG